MQHWRLLEYTLTCQRDERDTLHTRVMLNADCCTEHRLVCCKVAFTFKPPPKRKSLPTKKLENHSLHDPRVKNNLQVTQEERLHCVTAEEPEEQWKKMKTMLQETTAKVLFDEAGKEIQEILEKKSSCHNCLLAKPVIKLPRLHTRPPAVHSKLSLGLYRMTGGQHLLRGHNAMLTWVTSAPSMRH